jgi:hypothetical protein
MQVHTNLKNTKHVCFSNYISYEVKIPGVGVTTSLGILLLNCEAGGAKNKEVFVKRLNILEQTKINVSFKTPRK